MSGLTKRHGLPYVWVTWITGLLSGEKQCTWSAWFKAHYRYTKRPDPSFDSAAWTSKHQAALGPYAARLEADGYSVTREDQNAFRLKGKVAILAGKMDLIAVPASEPSLATLIVDTKTGQPRASDWWQVLIYMFVLPQVMPAIPQAQLGGVVVYSDHEKVVDRAELTPERVQAIVALLLLVGGDVEPRKVPSGRECAFCDISECPARVKEDEDGGAAVGQASGF